MSFNAFQTSNDCLSSFDTRVVQSNFCTNILAPCNSGPKFMVILNYVMYMRMKAENNYR